MIRRAARSAAGVLDIFRWREGAAHAAVLMATLLGAYGLVWLETTRPLPPRERLVRIDGTVEKMRIDLTDASCFLGLNIDTGSRRVKAGNTMLCRKIRRLKPLPRGAPVTVLVEPVAAGRNQIWELRSGNRVLIAYEEIRAVREKQLRAVPWVGSLIAAICLPLALIIVGWLWMELSRLVRSIRSPFARD